MLAIGPYIKMLWLVFVIFITSNQTKAQLKFLIEDFEGFADGTTDLRLNGVFSYGNIKLSVEKSNSQLSYSGDRYLKVKRDGKLNYGGWGKGMNINVMLDAATDFLNFYIYQPSGNDTNSIKIQLQDDDNNSNAYEKEKDDVWEYLHKTNNKNDWQLISIPLSKFSDSNKAGDGKFNINYKEGKLLTILISFVDSKKPNTGQNWAFDFICFSKGKLPTGSNRFDAPAAALNDHCSLGAWSQEGNSGTFTDISNTFENYFNASSNKKLGVVHFFQPFSFDGGKTQNSYPSVERINKVLHQGYLPMITLEDHFINMNPGTKQPNLYSIIEGHFDPFITTWAKQIKQVDGIVLLRILHEFNGDWYPWCTANNDKDPALLIKAFRHIHDIFTEHEVTNVKFIWCANALSYPQEKWNFVMDAYPGNDYVDIVGMDAYNGAGKAAIWRSFRKEAIENYFILTQALPDKPFFICEISSRERWDSEPANSQTKSEWIRDMSKALSTDMSKIKLLAWFNENGKFKINTSPEAQQAYSVFIWNNAYFQTGTDHIHSLIKK